MNHGTKRIARALFESAYLPDIFSPERLAAHAGIPLQVILAALRAGELPGREVEPAEWRLTKRAALDWLDCQEEARDEE